MFMEVSQLLGHPPVYFAPDNLIVELKNDYCYGRCIYYVCNRVCRR